VEDAAHAFPAKYRGHRIGEAEDAGSPVLTAFSFYATKNLTTGEGGMLTGAAETIDDARVWSLHGISADAWRRQGRRAWAYEVTRPGFKYNMPDIQAAMGIAQLPRVASFASRREEIGRRYNEAFAHFEELRVPAHRPDVEHAWHIYALRVDDTCISRDQFIEELFARNIAASVHFIPVHLHQYYREKYGWSGSDYPVASREWERLVSLPIYPAMSDADVGDVIEAVSGIVTANRKAAAGYAASRA
jgi:dTDP-4-amino-4,6-dideoxygalactose transaminase